MTRETYAARQLTKQVRERDDDAYVTVGSTTDGLGVHRQVRYDDATAAWLAPLLDVIATLDKRITDHTVNDDGTLTVTFASGTIADDRTPFPLDDVQAVLNGDGNGDS